MSRMAIIGIDDEQIGTIAWRDGQFVVTGDEDEMRGLIRRLRGNRTPEEFIASLPRRLGSRYWAVAIPSPKKETSA